MSGSLLPIAETVVRTVSNMTGYSKYLLPCKLFERALIERKCILSGGAPARAVQVKEYPGEKIFAYAAYAGNLHMLLPVQILCAAKPEERTPMGAKHANTSSPSSNRMTTANGVERRVERGSTQKEQAPTKGRLRWTPADIAVGAAVGVACGVIFQGFNFVYPVISSLLGAVLPGLASLFHAIWYASGVFAVLVIRKPGAAVYVNLVGSFAEMVIGNQYAFGFVVISAMLQGVCSEIPFAVARYRRFALPLAIAGGALTGVEYGVYLLLFRYAGVSLLSPRGITHMICEVIGGMAIAGAASWFLYVALAKTGALDRLASGRAVRGGTATA